MCGVLIDCGAAWKPDFLKAIDTIGILGIFFIVFAIGLFASNLIKQINSNTEPLNLNMKTIILLYFIFLFMVSLPIGNFVFASSSNTIIAVYLFINQLYKFKK
jgi:hypothetical protein